MFQIFLIILIIFLGFYIAEFVIKKPPVRFDIYFGVPGSGKTTFAAKIAKKAIKNKQKVLSNVPIKGTFKVEKSDIGHYQIDNCHLIIDEIGVDYNNRRFKSFTDEEVYFFKHHRHYRVHVYGFSQGYNDMDLKIRTLATRLYVVTPSLIPFFIKKKRIKKRIGIDDLTKQIIDEYKFFFLGHRYIFAPAVWKMFKTEDAKELPSKEWEQY